MFFSSLKNTLSVRLFLIAILSLISCSQPKISLDDCTNSDLVMIIIDDNEPESIKEIAVDQLKSRKAWKDLVKTLPPAGRYGGTSINVISALHEVNNKETIPHLKRVLRTKEFMSGEFRVFIKGVIKDMEAFHGTQKNR